jgi:hypothetical protein
MIIFNKEMINNFSFIMILILFNVICIISNNATMIENNNDQCNNNNNNKIEIINNLNIPLIFKLWIATGILVNYMQTIIYVMRYD